MKQLRRFYQRAFDLEGRQDDTRLQYQVIQPYKCFYYCELYDLSPSRTTWKFQ